MSIINRLGLGRGNRGQQNNQNRNRGRMMTPGGGGRGMGGGGRGQGGGGRGMGQGQGTGGGCRGAGGTGRGLGRGQGQNMAGQGMCQTPTPAGNAQAPSPTPNKTIKRVAVSTEGNNLDATVESRFGRASGFMIVDIDSMNAEFIDNTQSQSMAQGAGIQAAENIVDAGADAVLTGRVGPKATNALNAAGVFIAQDFAGMTIREAVKKFASSL